MHTASSGGAAQDGREADSKAATAKGRVLPIEALRKRAAAAAAAAAPLFPHHAARPARCSFFGNFGFGGFGFGQQEEETPKGNNVVVELEVTLRDLFLGGHFKVGPAPPDGGPRGFCPVPSPLPACPCGAGAMRSRGLAGRVCMR